MSWKAQEFTCSGSELNGTGAGLPTGGRGQLEYFALGPTLQGAQRGPPGSS